jgi:hypothetical protein
MSSTATQLNSSYLLHKLHSFFNIIHSRQKGPYIP